MANIKSQKKRILTNEKARLRNRVQKTLVKNAIKNLNNAIETGNKEEATLLLAKAYKRIDSSVIKGITHKNKAARQKSRLSKKVNAM
jgi:small subunit ribosomal protein S20